MEYLDIRYNEKKAQSQNNNNKVQNSRVAQVDTRIAGGEPHETQSDQDCFVTPRARRGASFVKALREATHLACSHPLQESAVTLASQS